MSLDRILSSAGTSRFDLDSTVAQYRTMSAGYEMILADHFDVEDMAVTIEALARQLERIEALAAPLLDDPSNAGDLARSIGTVLAGADPEAAIEVVDGAINRDLTGVLNYGAERFYGHPDLALVSHFTFDFETLSRTTLRHLVHTPSGRFIQVPENDSVFDAADAFEKTLADA